MLFNNPGQPLFLSAGDLAGAGAAAVLVAQTAYLGATYTPVEVVLTGLRVDFGVASGNYDVGIYDVNGNRLTSRGATAIATGVQTWTLPAPIVLPGGSYWLAYWVDNATATVVKYATLNAAGMAPFQTGTNATNLPATTGGLTGLANAAKCAVVIGLLQGGWS